MTSPNLYPIRLSSRVLALAKFKQSRKREIQGKRTHDSCSSNRNVVEDLDMNLQIDSIDLHRLACKNGAYGLKAFASYAISAPAVTYALGPIQSVPFCYVTYGCLLCWWFWEMWTASMHILLTYKVLIEEEIHCIPSMFNIKQSQKPTTDLNLQQYILEQDITAHKRRDHASCTGKFSRAWPGMDAR